jgi:hypothetical protein
VAVGVTGRGGLGGAVLSGFPGRVLAAGAVLVFGIWAAGRLAGDRGLALLAGFAAGGRGLGCCLVLSGGAGDRGVTGRAGGVRGPGCAGGLGGKADGGSCCRPPGVRDSGAAALGALGGAGDLQLMAQLVIGTV